MVTRNGKARVCENCGRTTHDEHETTCTICGYLTREAKKVVTKGKAIEPEEMVDLSEEE